MSYVCKRGHKCMCFQCPEKDCEHYESEPPEWVKNNVENLDNIPTIEERKSTIEFPHVFIAEGYDSIKSEDGETGFGVYDPENKQIFIAGAVPDEIFVKALSHELMHWVQDISGYAFNEGEANTFAENIYNTMESYIVTNRWIPCSERMPEEHDWIGTKTFGTTISDEVYVTFENPKGERFCKHLSFQNGKLSAFDKSTIDAFYKGSKPIAWMPMPEPYREDGEE